MPLYRIHNGSVEKIHNGSVENPWGKLKLKVV